MSKHRFPFFHRPFSIIHLPFSIFRTGAMLWTLITRLEAFK